MDFSFVSQLKLIVFDLDRTLTESKSPLEEDMAELVAELVTFVPIVIITGGTFDQLSHQFISKLKVSQSLMSRVYLAPTSGGRMYAYDTSWHVIYADDLPSSARETIIGAMKSMLREPEFLLLTKHDDIGAYGDVIEDRGSQVTFSALGMQAPPDLKEAWDPDRKKRLWILDYLTSRLPEYEIRTGGATSVDVTRRGADKGTAIERIAITLNIPKDSMLFIGDALEIGGNDNPVFLHGVFSIDVNSPTETRVLLERIITTLHTLRVIE